MTINDNNLIAAAEGKGWCMNISMLSAKQNKNYIINSEYRPT